MHFNIVKLLKQQKRLGVITYVTDYLPIDKSPATQISDHYYMYNIAEVEKIVEACKRDGIDGAIALSLDPCQRPYQQICEKAGFPCFGTKEQFFKLTDKNAFKQSCVENGVDVIPEYYVITPVLIETLHVNLYLLLAGSFVFTWVVGLIPYIGSTFQLSRLVCFYPYFLLEILLRGKYHSHIENQSLSKYVACAWGVLLCMLIWFVAETVNPGIVYTTGFTGGYGLSLNGILKRIFCQVLCTVELF